MILKMYAMRDIAVADFGRVQFLQANGQAIRMFGDEINRADKDNLLYMHPEDYELFYLGEFDTATAKFSPVDPEQIAVGKNLVIQKQ